MPGQGPLSLNLIVSRLRLSLCLATVLIVAVCVLAVLHLRAISERTDQMVGTSLPLLIGTHAVVPLLMREAERAARLRLPMPPDTLDMLRNQARTDAAELDRRFSDLGTEAPLHVDDLAAVLARLRTADAALFDIQATRHGIAARRAEVTGALRTTLRDLQDKVQTERLSQFERIETKISSRPEAFSPDRLRARIFDLGTVIALELVAEDLISAVRAGDAERADISFDLRTLVQQAARLENGAAKEAISRDIARIREGVEAIRDLAQREAALDRRVELTLSDHAEALTALRTEVGLTVRGAEAAILDAGAALDRTIGRSLAASAVLGFAACAAMALALYLLVERQINRRLRRLSHAVHVIAGGDYDHEIDVGGNDELTAIAEMLEEAKKTAKALVRTNRDLQSFTYAASHDMRGPIKAIRDLAEWTLEDALNELSQDNLNKLQLLGRRTERLAILLDDMIRYVGSDGFEPRVARIDIAEEVADLRESHDPRGAFEFVVEDEAGPFEAPVAAMRQVLGGLIDNAVTHHDRGSGRIVVAARWRDGRIAVSVADDGPGIPAEFQERIFDLFQTLRPRDVVEGSGIGLSICRKIAQGAGGGITVASDPGRGRGSTFTFTLPARPAAGARQAA